MPLTFCTGAQVAVPETRVLQRGQSAAGWVFLWREGSAKDRPHPNDMEEVETDRANRNETRLIHAAHDHSGRARAHNFFKAGRALAPIEKDPRGRLKPFLTAQSSRLDRHQSLGIRIAQRTKQNRVDHSKNSG